MQDPRTREAYLITIVRFNPPFHENPNLFRAFVENRKGVLWKCLNNINRSRSNPNKLPTSIKGWRNLALDILDAYLRRGSSPRARRLTRYERQWVI